MPRRSRPRRLMSRAKAQGLYPGAYYPHNIHFLMTSAQMGGDGETAVNAAEKLYRAMDDAIVRAVPWTQPNKQAPFFAHAQYSDPAARSEEHTSELQSLMRTSYAVFCLKKKKETT